MSRYKFFCRRRGSDRVRQHAQHVDRQPADVCDVRRRAGRREDPGGVSVHQGGGSATGGHPGELGAGGKILNLLKQFYLVFEMLKLFKNGRRPMAF